MCVRSSLIAEPVLTHSSLVACCPPARADDDDGVGDFVEDDLGEGFAGDDDFGVRKDKKLLASIGVQEAFQPGSTPKGGTGEARFLCYNVIGSITSVEEQTAASIEGADANTNTDKIHIVQLNYTDQTKHKASKFRDFFGFIVAAVGPHGTVFGRSQHTRPRQARDGGSAVQPLTSAPVCCVL